MTNFDEVNEVRNIVFYFRRGITAKNTDRLRDRLRYDRELYAKQVGDQKELAAKSD